MKTFICQSCGMPMAATEHFGINTDLTVNKEYCCFCYKDGKFTDNFSFMEFVEDAVQNNSFCDQKEYDVSKDEKVLREIVHLQELKRWKTHQTIHQGYYRAVNEVIDYITIHLTETLNLTNLSRIACISEYHFHRIFKAIMGESPGEYIIRLRLEKGAFKLQTTSLSLQEIAEQIGYQTVYAFSKAFKKRYNISPAAFRKSPIDLSKPMNEPVSKMDLQPEIKSISDKKVIYTRVIDPYTHKNAFLEAWQELVNFTGLSGIPDKENEYITLSRDSSSITQPKHCRIYACITVQENYKAKGKFGIQTIEGGEYAVFTFQGGHEDLETLYCNIYRYWIPTSNYQLRDSLHFEVYLNNPKFVSKENLITQIYIPIHSPKKK